MQRSVEDGFEAYPEKKPIDHILMSECPNRKIDNISTIVALDQKRLDKT